MKNKSLSFPLMEQRDRSYYSENLMSLLTLFQILLIVLILIRPSEVAAKQKILFSAALLVVVYLSNALLNRLTHGDVYIFMIANMLFTIGVVMVFRIRPETGIRQMVWYVIAIFCFFVVYFILRLGKKWDHLFWFYLAVCVGLSLITLVFGKTINGATNWIVIQKGGEPLVSFQPSEITKISLVFMLAAYYNRYDDFKDLVLFGKKIGSYFIMGVVYILIGFMFLQKDLGTAVIFYATFICAQFIYEEDRRMLWINLGLAIVGAVIAVILFNHVRVRIITWINPWDHIEGMGYQITQSLFAIASGGFFGTGYGLGRPDYIPLAFSDFIYASVIEEMGIFMGIAVLMLYMILIYRGFKIALAQQNRFFRTVAVLTSILIAGQVILIIGGVLKLIPLTGVTTPFLSAGGSSLLMSFIMLAVLQYCSEDLEIKEALDEKRK